MKLNNDFDLPILNQHHSSKNLEEIQEENKSHLSLTPSDGEPNHNEHKRHTRHISFAGTE